MNQLLNLELAELLDDALAILREGLGELTPDLFLVQTHWLTARQEYRISVWVRFGMRFRWQSEDRDLCLEILREEVGLVRRQLEWVKSERIES